MEDLVPFSSLLLGDVVGTPEMRTVWSERNLIQKWMNVEVAIGEAQADIGLIPRSAADRIRQSLNLETLPARKIKETKDRVGHLMVAFLKAFSDECPEAADHLHLGPTTQDILDTGLTLQIRESHRIIVRQLLELEEVLCERAMEHRDTVVMGRSHAQHALPVTFGFVLATVAQEIRDHIDRARDSERRWNFGTLSGAVGAHNAFVELGDEDTGHRLESAMCSKLGLEPPPMDLHTRTERFAEIVNNLALVCNSLGKFGLNLRWWQASEVGEAAEPYGATEYSSSTMPNKRNPESSEHAAGIAAVVRGLAVAMQDVQMLDNRDGTRVPIEFVCIPTSFLLSSRALLLTIRNVGGLQVHGEKMRANLDHPDVRGQAAAERLMLALYKKTGRRDWAHSLCYECAKTSWEQNLHLKDVVVGHPELGPLFSARELDRIFDLSTYTGSAERQTEQAVERIREARRRDREAVGESRP